ncbi:MAG: guanylate kinase [Aeriscardovia sp.]|nr:guanylate kinase [Aeriscardovia sp.]
MSHSRRLIILTGPTAVGKGTVEAALRAKHPEIWVSVSATTRAPRPGEENGKDYIFLSNDSFNQMKEAGDFLETAVVHGMAQYGTPLQPVLDHLTNDALPPVLEIDLQGARRVKKHAAELGLEILSIFLAPPSFDDLISRLSERGTESEEQKKARLQTARTELAAQDEFDCVIVNQTVDSAADELWDAIASGIETI